MTDRFHHENDISAAYESAEIIVAGLVQRNVVLVPDEREPARTHTIRRLARDVTDAVIRSGYENLGDISEIPGVQIERVS
jgi:hypothetical protein